MPRKRNILSYVLQMIEKLQQVSTTARESLRLAQAKQKAWYDRKGIQSKTVPSWRLSPPIAADIGEQTGGEMARSV